MKHYTFPFIIICLLFSSAAIAQTADVSEAYQTDVRIRKTGMLVLGSWAVANIISGGVGRNQLSGEKAYFHEMNAIWNVVNLGIAGAGYYFTVKGSMPNELTDQFNSQINFQKILLFNAGLDLAYIVGGFYLMERSKNTAKLPERLKGYGKSIILQGAFLFTFDVLMYTIHKNKTTPLTEFMSHIIIGPQQIGWVYQF